MRELFVFLALSLAAGSVAAAMVFSPVDAAAQTGVGVATAPSGEQDAAASDPRDSAASAVDRRLNARAKGLYTYLRGKRINIYSVYQSDAFRDYFETEKALENYIAYITSRLARRRFRKYQIEGTELLELSITGIDRARARIKLIGRHRQPFLFWDKTETIENEWRRIDGEWFVYPPPF